MKSITVKETKIVMVLTTTDFLLSVSLKKCWESHSYMRDKEVKVINQDIKIPSINGKVRDTVIEYNDITFYTCSEFIQEKEIVTQEKELFIPDFGVLNSSVCDSLEAKQCLNDHSYMRCEDCICNEDYFKYLKD